MNRRERKAEHEAEIDCAPGPERPHRILCDLGPTTPPTALRTSQLWQEPVAEQVAEQFCCMAITQVPTGSVVMALRKASGDAIVEMVCVPSPTP
jgi:hypothetical protein